MPDLWDFVDDRNYDNRNREIAKKEKELEKLALEKANAYLEKARQAELAKQEKELPKDRSESRKSIRTKSVIDDLLSGEKRQLPKFHQRKSFSQIQREKQKAKTNNPEVITDDELDFADLGLLHIEKDKDQSIIDKEKSETKAKTGDFGELSESLPSLNAPVRVLEFDLGVNLPLQNEISGVEIEHQLEHHKIEVPKISREDYSLSAMLSKKLEILQSKKRHKDFERHREIKQATFDRYDKDIKKVFKVLGNNPTQEQVLKYIIKQSVYETEGNYNHTMAGVREGYRDLYNDIYLALPKPHERENMKLQRRRSGYGDIPDSRPVILARQEELEPEKIQMLIDDLPCKWHKEAVRLIEISGCRRNEIGSMTMKLTGRGNRATMKLEWIVSKQKNGKENFNSVVIHQEHFPDEFRELGTMLLNRNKCSSLRNSTFEKVKIFEKSSQNGEALGKAIQRSTKKLVIDPKLYKSHSLRHQLGTDLRNNGMDDLGIAERLGHKLSKNSNFYGINK